MYDKYVYPYLRMYPVSCTIIYDVPCFLKKSDPLLFIYTKTITQKGALASFTGSDGSLDVPSEELLIVSHHNVDFEKLKDY